MDKNNKRLEEGLKKYIDSWTAAGKEELKQLLQHTPAKSRYDQLMNVRGDKYDGNTGPHRAAWENDLATMKHMLEDLTADQKYDVLKIQDRSQGTSALHYAAWSGFSSTITYLLAGLSQQQKYDLLQLRKKDGGTPLHNAASQH